MALNHSAEFKGVIFLHPCYVACKLIYEFENELKIMILKRYKI